MAVACGLLALTGTAEQALARQYGAGDISYLMNLWNTNRAGYLGTVQNIDTFSALGTVDTVSKTVDGSGFDVVVTVGLSAEVSCTTGAADLVKGDQVTVSGRIGRATTALSQATMNQIGGPGGSRDSLGLQSCMVEKVSPPK
ncbi:MAG TPA: hypothetical protein VKQ29_03455 [Aliidongia sp.]|nr:hypothetical protein [Aliidongia sp.]